MSNKSIVKTLFSSASRFRRDDKGQIALMFGLALLPIMGFVGSAVDYSRATTSNSRLQAGADAAALNAVAQGRGTHIAPADSLIRDYFAASAGTDPDTSVTSFSTTHISDPAALTVTVNYSADVTTTFMNIFGVSKVNVQGTATAKTEMRSYVDVHVLTDTMPAAPITKADGTPDVAADTAREIEHKKNLRKSTREVADAVEKTEQDPKKFEMDIHVASEKYEKVTDLDRDYQKQRGEADKIEIKHDTHDDSDKRSAIDRGLDELNKSIRKSGNGASAEEREHHIVIVTDGAEFEHKKVEDSAKKDDREKREVQMINQDLCKMVKDRGIKIEVLYTPGTNETLNQRGDYEHQHSDDDGSKVTKITRFQKALQDCASPGLYTTVASGLSVASPAQSTLKTAMTTVRLTK